MKIGIDARWILRESSGIGVYTRELLRQLARLDLRNEYTVFFSDPEVQNTMAGELAAGVNFRARLIDFGPFSIRNQLRLPKLIRQLGLDVFHSTNYMIPLPAFPRHHPGRTACVINVHDLIPLVFPKATPRALKTRLFPVYRQLMKEVAARSSLIITASRSARDDIVRCLRGRPERVAVIPDGVSAAFRRTRPDLPPAQDPRLMRRNKIILWVGRRDPYKNLAGLVEAFALLRKNYRGPLELRLVGAEDPRYPEGPQLVDRLGLADAVTWTGHVTEQELVAEYQNANLFVLPSLYEGFGLPVLEAFACGTPVVCSNKSSLPEVGGKAALLVDPRDTRGLCEAMRRVLTDSRLAAELAARGIEQAAKYSWRETARQTILAYEKAATLK